MMPTKNKQTIYAEVVLRSRTGASLLKDATRVTTDSLHLYQANEDSPAETAQKLEAAGFTVIASSRFGVSIAGPEKLYEDYFKTKIAKRPVQMFFGGGQQHQADAFFMDETPRLPNDVSNLAETMYIPRRGWFLAGEGPMPTPAYYHLRPPDDIVRLTNADHAHSRGFRGTGVKVAMCDSGFIENHDYYAGRGYNLTVHAAVGSVTQDEYGHGTGIAVNLLAIAPECEFHFFKMSDAVNWASLAAFRMAVSEGAKIITNSWGQWHDPVLEAEIQAAVAAGITVIFACGNGGTVGWPGCMPEIISVGGAYPRPDGTWEASTYASSGVNTMHPNRHCPDLSAIVGQAPRGILIVVPTMAGAIFDGSFSGGAFPNGDETAGDDGWMVASGTSSAAPMVAGAAALLLQARSSLTPTEIKDILADTCIDVVNGASASGEVAGIGPDSATGAGMIEVGAAIDKVAPYVICPRAPLCPRVPIDICPKAPLECLRVPVVQCLRAPLECRRLPLIECLRAPIIECLRAPLIPACPPSPVVGCLAGPWRDPIDPIERIREPIDIRRPVQPTVRRYVPVVVMMDAEELAAGQTGSEGELSHSRARARALQAARQAYYATLEELGVEEEYANFPDVEGCQKGPFKPTVDV
jgi:subtilisin family serine protease